MSRPDADTLALADHGYAAKPPQPKRRRHASVPAGATPSRWVPPVMPVTVGPPAKRRVDWKTSQFAASHVASGDSFHTPIFTRQLPTLARLSRQLAPVSRRCQRRAHDNREPASQVSFDRGHLASVPPGIPRRALHNKPTGRHPRRVPRGPARVSRCQPARPHC